MFSFYQKSINKKIQFKGIGLHTGKKVNMTLLPAPPNHGIIFKRIDLKTKNLIEANFLNVRNAMLCTKIENEFKVSVSTIEHLMGALYGEKINNLLIEIDSSELPIMDGSAKDFIEKIKEVGVKQYDTLKKYVKVLKKFEYNVGKKTIQSVKSFTLTVTTLKYAATAAILKNVKELIAIGNPRTISVDIPARKINP
mgnify:CR=1 FL=1